MLGMCDNSLAKQSHRGGVSFYNLTWGNAPPASGHGVPVGCLAANDKLAGGFCMATHKCMDCGGSLSPNSPDFTKRCRNCHIKYLAANRKEYACLDCGIEIHPGNTRCIDCHRIRTPKKRSLCLDCGKEITRTATRCWDCSVIAKKGSVVGDGPPMGPRQVCPSCGEKKDHRSKLCQNCARTPKLEKKCTVCGKPTDHRAKSHCWNCWHSRGRTPNLCIDCGKEISHSCLRCSVCYGKYRSVTFIGENHPRWLGGNRTYIYPPEFNDDLKKFIRARDGYKCQECGILEGDTTHHCHHIDYDKFNSDPINLITLCHPCHSSTNGGNANRNYWQHYFESIMKGRATWKQLGMNL